MRGQGCYPYRTRVSRRSWRFPLILCKLDYNFARADEAELLPSDVLDESRVSSQSLNIPLERFHAYGQVLKFFCRRCVLDERAAELSSRV